MAVLLPDRMLTVVVHDHPQIRDKRGTPVATATGAEPERGPFPGAAARTIGNTWNLRVDPRCWPIRAGDTITDGAHTWVADPVPLLKRVPGHPDADFIRVPATLDPPEVP